jgi:hypothetical protein
MTKSGKIENILLKRLFVTVWVKFPSAKDSAQFKIKYYSFKNKNNAIQILKFKVKIQ